MGGSVGRVNIQFDLTNCDKEPIRTPGAILPHGAMLVLDCDTYEISQAAGETLDLLGRPLDELLGQKPETMLRPDHIRL
jgi:chemotaxis family two-component system sensor kinase Cph1